MATTRPGPSRSPSSTPSSCARLGLLSSLVSSPHGPAQPDSPRRAHSARKTSRGCSGCASTTPPRRTTSSSAPRDVATRAEAAVLGRAHPRLARLASLDTVTNLAATFRSDSSPGSRRSVLQTAVSFVGYPYVWGGTSELPQDPFGTGTGGPWRLRLFGVRLARVQAPGLCRRRPRCRPSRRTAGRPTR